MRRLVLGIAVAVTSLMPVLGVADDQQIADFIKSRLQAEQTQGNLRGFNVDMRVQEGTVWFKGHVANSEQEMTILRTAQQAGHLGVVKVVDDIETKAIAQPTQTAATPSQPANLGLIQGTDQTVATPIAQSAPIAQSMPIAQPAQAPQQIQAAQPAPMAQPAQNSVFQAQPAYPQASPYQQASSRVYAPGAMQGTAGGNQPLPFATAGGPTAGPSAMPASYASPSAMPSEAPNLPGYAWPGYAASPNYGALSYPKQHSASAWPYIGPFYPYPQVPLGWRKVSLEWDDGWWMLDFHDK
ncbi:MAG: BON domain-containing protein [Mariniblastus sp.]|nr:BON domain-containing protein [Mariniblastus sp.]